MDAYRLNGDKLCAEGGCEKVGTLKQKLVILAEGYIVLNGDRSGTAQHSAQNSQRSTRS
jgi:hypothetical protein